VPYIDKKRRAEYEKLVVAFRVANTTTSMSEGDLNYVLTTLVLTWLRAVPEGAINYARLNTLLGVLESVKLEMYRRVIVPYENRKAMLNGDVY